MDSTLITLLDSFKNKRFESYDLFDNYKQEILYLYKSKLNDEIKSLPNGFWVGEDGLVNSRIVIDYIVLEILGKSLKDLPDILDSKFFKEHMLSGLLKYHKNTVELIMEIYPEMFHMFEFKVCPDGLWKRPNKFESARNLINYNLEKFGYSDKDIYTVNWGSFFGRNNMSNMYHELFDGDIFKILEFTFEGTVIKKEDIVYKGKWDDDELCYKVVNEMIERLNKDIDSLTINDIKRSDYYSMVICRFKTVENVKKFYKG